MTQNCRSRSNRHTIGLGITLWGVTLLVGITMLLLANFGVPVWATIASALWLFTAGFPTTLAVIVTAYFVDGWSFWVFALVVGAVGLAAHIATVRLLWGTPP